MVDVAELAPEKIETISPKLSQSACLEFGGLAIGCSSCPMIEFCTRRLNVQITQEQEATREPQAASEYNSGTSTAEESGLNEASGEVIAQVQIDYQDIIVEQSSSTPISGESQVVEELRIVDEKQSTIVKPDKIKTESTGVDKLELGSEALTQTNYLEELMDDSIDIVLADVYRDGPEPDVRVVAVEENSDTKINNFTTEAEVGNNNPEVVGDLSEFVIIPTKESIVVTPEVVSFEAQGFLPIRSFMKKIKPVVPSRITKKDIQIKDIIPVEDISGVDLDVGANDDDNENKVADLVISARDNQPQIENIFESNLIQDDEPISGLAACDTGGGFGKNLGFFTDDNDVELISDSQEEFDEIFTGIISQNFPEYFNNLTNFIELKAEVDRGLFDNPISRGKESIDPETGLSIRSNNKVIIKINIIRKMLAFRSIYLMNMSNNLKNNVIK